MTPKEREAMQQALEALKEAYENGFLTGIAGLKTIDTITALREALAEQAEQEKPYSDKAAMFAQLGGMIRIDPVTGDVGIGTPPKTLDYVAPVQKAEQEPVAWVDLEQWQSGEYDCFTSEKVAEYMTPLYTAPVRKKDLTDDEIRKTTRDEKIVRPGVYEVSVEQAEQEPIYISESCAERGCACHYSVEVDGEPVAVYSAPVRTKDLTDDEIKKLQHKIDWTAEWSYVIFARAAITAYKEKNK